MSRIMDTEISIFVATVMGATDTVAAFILFGFHALSTTTFALEGAEELVVAYGSIRHRLLPALTMVADSLGALIIVGLAI